MIRVRSLADAPAAVAALDAELRSTNDDWMQEPDSLDDGDVEDAVDELSDLDDEEPRRSSAMGYGVSTSRR